MSVLQIFKRVLIPCAAGVTSAAGVADGHTHGANCVKKTEEGKRPSDLPIYSRDCLKCREACNTLPPPSGMEEAVGNIRKELWVWQDNLKGYRHKIVDVYRSGVSNADCSGKSRSSGHLDNCLKQNESPCREEEPKPKFVKLCVDRCGRPCSGEHRNHSHCQQPKPKSFLSKKTEHPPDSCEQAKKPPPSEGSHSKDYCPCCKNKK